MRRFLFGYNLIWLELCFLFLLLISACDKKEKKTNWDTPMVAIQTENPEKVLVKVELASTEAQREQGLKHRKELKEDEGMLFIFPYPGYYRFWMKDTLIPLDIIFIGADFEIKGIIQNAPPESEKPIGIDKPSQYVLEVNGGFCEKSKIKIKDKVEFLGFEVMK